MPLPDRRPSEQIAKLFPQIESAPAKVQSKNQVKDQAKDQKAAAPVAPGSTVAQATSPTAATVPLPEPRPKIAPEPEQPRHHYFRRYHQSR